MDQTGQTFPEEGTTRANVARNYKRNFANLDAALVLGDLCEDRPFAERLRHEVVAAARQDLAALVLQSTRGRAVGFEVRGNLCEKHADSGAISLARRHLRLDD